MLSCGRESVSGKVRIDKNRALDTSAPWCSNYLGRQVSAEGSCSRIHSRLLHNESPGSRRRTSN
jgi:hypothetical protein